MSSLFPVWWSDTITIYNRYEDKETNQVKWYRTVLPDCFWQNRFGLVKAGQVELQTSSVTCRIPANSSFLNKQNWDNLLNDSKNNYFTLSQGDIIVKGAVTDEIDEYTSGSRSNDLIQKYKWQGCILIENLNDNSGPGRGLPHYHVDGV